VSGTIAGSQTVTAQTGPGIPAALVSSSGTPQSTVAGAAFATALSAKVTDSFNSPVAGVTVTFQAPASGPSAGLLASSAVTNASGIAAVTAVANSLTGVYNVTAATGSLSSTFALTNTAGANNKCDINGDGFLNVTDVQLLLNQTLGSSPVANDLNGDRLVNVRDVQIAMNAALGQGCSAS